MIDKELLKLIIKQELPILLKWLTNLITNLVYKMLDNSVDVRSMVYKSVYNDLTTNYKDKNPSTKIPGPGEK